MGSADFFFSLLLSLAYAIIIPPALCLEVSTVIFFLKLHLNISATNIQVFILPTAPLAYSAVWVFSFLSVHSFSSLIGKSFLGHQLVWLWRLNI